MADKRYSLKRPRYNQKTFSDDELYHELNSDVSDEFSEDEFSELSEDESEFLLNDSFDDEEEIEDPLAFYDNSDRIVTINSEKWETNVIPIPQFPFTTDPSGEIKADISNSSTPRDVFNELFTNHIMEMLVNATNQYGKNLYGKPVPATRKSPKVVFSEANTDEIYKFFGLSLLMGQSKFPTIRRAFSKDPLYYHPIFSATMSGRRYQMLLRTINCHTPIADAEKNEKLVRVNPLIQALIEKFNDAFTPGKQLSLDESLLLWRGRLSFRQYIKTKAARYGIKFYELTTSDGYVLNMQIYQGRDAESDKKGDKTKNLVLALMKPYLNKGHHLFMDNFYNSVTLCNHLLSNGTHTTGTLRSNRKENPKKVIESKLKKGESIWQRSGKVYVTKWKDKRDVISITTAHHPKLVEAANRFGEVKVKPNDVAEYNKYMSGVDRLDQMTSYYNSTRKTRRWYKKVLLHLLDIAVWNSYFLYRRYHRKTTFLMFRESLITSLISLPEYIVEGRQLVQLTPSLGRPRSEKAVVEPAFLNMSEITVELEIEPAPHVLEQIPVEATYKRKTKFQRCKKCAKNKIRKETSKRCIGCSGQPPLCTACFKITHNSF